MNKTASILQGYAGIIDENCGSRKRLVGCKPSINVLDIPLDRIVPDESQPRKEFGDEELYALAGSLRANGQLAPIRTRYDEQSDTYVIVVGERRWRAAAIAGMATMQCVVDDIDSANAETQIVENLHRADLKPIESARAYRALMEARGWTAKQCADALHVSDTKVTTTLRLLELPPKDQERVNAGELTYREGLQLVREVKPKRKPKKKVTIRKITIGDSVVTIAIKKAKPTDADLVEILTEALAQARGDRKVKVAA